MAKTQSMHCCGVRVDGLGLDEAVTTILTAQRPTTVHLCNAFTLSLARSDPSYRRMLNAGQLNLPDGTPLAWLARRAGLTDATHAARGPDLMRAVLLAGRAQGLRHYLYGGHSQALFDLQRELAELAPGAIVAGAEAPPFRPLSAADYDAAAKRIDAVSADIVWVGLGTPKQDWAASELGRRCAAVVIPVGAAFDFLSGNTREAPKWLRGSGFEWMFRLVVEPRRLWRRYLVGNLMFLVGVARDGLRRVES